MKLLTNLPPNSIIFSDANILAYFFTRKDELAQVIARFLARSVNAEIKIVTSTAVVADVIHRVMISEVMKAQGIESGRAATYLKKHPDIVKTLPEHLTVPSKLYNQFKINILDVTRVELYSSRVIRAKYGLMTNDSIIVATMQRHKILHLATNDRDFDRVQEIQVWSP